MFECSSFFINAGPKLNWSNICSQQTTPLFLEQPTARERLESLLCVTFVHYRDSGWRFTGAKRQALLTHTTNSHIGSKSLAVTSRSIPADSSVRNKSSCELFCPVIGNFSLASHTSDQFLICWVSVRPFTL